jgi:1-deoxy-D-xylulose-5-phosphate reductoisomerase
VKSLSILGSTGSIGRSALRVVDSFNDRFDVMALSCHANLELFFQQIKEYKPRYAAVSSKEAVSSSEFREIKNSCPGVCFFEGESGVAELASLECDILLSAIVGYAGLAPALSAMGRAKRIALANKETLVVAGDLVMQRAAETGCEIIPVDSEHSAIFFLLENRKREDIARIIITASGGSLRDRSREELEHVTPEEALAHPTWNMGAKITIDSATLMNKGLEVIEAHHLFKLSYDMIDVVVHPESVVHSMVETRDGSLYAHMGVTDMVFPIIGALTYPEKVENPFGRLDLAKIGSLTFRECDHVRFPALDLCYEAGRTGGTSPAVLNAANEAAVQAFLDRRIGYGDIVSVVTATLEKHHIKQSPSLEELFEADRAARECAELIIRGL